MNRHGEEIAIIGTDKGKTCGRKAKVHLCHGKMSNEAPLPQKTISGRAKSVANGQKHTFATGN